MGLFRVVHKLGRGEPKDHTFLKSVTHTPTMMKLGTVVPYLKKIKKKKKLNNLVNSLSSTETSIFSR